MADFTSLNGYNVKDKNARELIAQLQENVNQQIEEFKTHVNEQIENLPQTDMLGEFETYKNLINADIELFKQNINSELNSFKDTTNLNMENLQQSVNEQMLNFTNSVNNQLNTFKDYFRDYVKVYESYNYKFDNTPPVVSGMEFTSVNDLTFYRVSEDIVTIHNLRNAVFTEYVDGLPGWMNVSEILLDNYNMYTGCYIMGDKILVIYQEENDFNAPVGVYLYYSDSLNYVSGLNFDIYNREMIHKIPALQEELDNIKDRVMEIGTSGIWTYRKWESGIVECWGTYALNLSCNFTWGELYYDTRTLPNYPTGLFIDVPTTSLDCTTKEGTYWITSQYGTKESAGKFSVISPVAKTENLGVYIHVMAKGRWK